MSTPTKRAPYRQPTGQFIGRDDKTERLYRREQVRDAAIKSAGEELQRILGLEHFWQEALPEALLSVLEHWDRSAAYLAAYTYLAKHQDVGTELGLPAASLLDVPK